VNACRFALPGAKGFELPSEIGLLGSFLFLLWYLDRKTYPAQCRAEVILVDKNLVGE